MADSATQQNALPEAGQVVRFVGYSDSSVPPVFEVDQMIRIERVNDDGSMVAVPLDGGEGDTVFVEEIDTTSVDTSAPVSEEANEEPPFDVEEQVEEAAVAEAPVKASKPKAKAKSKAKQETAAEAVETAQTTALTVVEEDGGVRVSDSDAVARILSEQDALDAAKALVTQAEETYFTLGGVLAHIYYEGIFKAVGFTGKRGFADYVEQELGVQYRKAMYLIDIYVTFRKLGVDERRLTQIGWSKAKELTKFATPENFDELVDMAGDKTREELVQHLRTTMVDAETGNSERVQRSVYKFVMFGDAITTVASALTEAQQMSNSDKPEVALEYICAEWLSMTAGIEVPLEDEIRRIEAKYGVTLSVDEGDSQTDTVAA